MRHLLNHIILMTLGLTVLPGPRGTIQVTKDVPDKVTPDRAVPDGRDLSKLNDYLDSLPRKAKDTDTDTGSGTTTEEPTGTTDSGEGSSTEKETKTNGSSDGNSAQTKITETQRLEQTVADAKLAWQLAEGGRKGRHLSALHAAQRALIDLHDSGAYADGSPAPRNESAYDRQQRVLGHLQGIWESGDGTDTPEQRDALRALGAFGDPGRVVDFSQVDQANTTFLAYTGVERTGDTVVDSQVWEAAGGRHVQAVKDWQARGAKLLEEFQQGSVNRTSDLTDTTDPGEWRARFGDGGQAGFVDTPEYLEWVASAPEDSVKYLTFEDGQPYDTGKYAEGLEEYGAEVLSDEANYLQNREERIQVRSEIKTLLTQLAAEGNVGATAQGLSGGEVLARGASNVDVNQDARVTRLAEKMRGAGLSDADIERELHLPLAINRTLIDLAKESEVGNVNLSDDARIPQLVERMLAAGYGKEAVTFVRNFVPRLSYKVAPEGAPTPEEAEGASYWAAQGAEKTGAEGRERVARAELEAVAAELGIQPAGLSNEQLRAQVETALVNTEEGPEGRRRIVANVATSPDGTTTFSQVAPRVQGNLPSEDEEGPTGVPKQFTAPEDLYDPGTEAEHALAQTKYRQFFYNLTGQLPSGDIETDNQLVNNILTLQRQSLRAEQSVATDVDGNVIDVAGQPPVREHFSLANLMDREVIYINGEAVNVADYIRDNTVYPDASSSSVRGRAQRIATYERSLQDLIDHLDEGYQSGAVRLTPPSVVDKRLTRADLGETFTIDGIEYNTKAWLSEVRRVTNNRLGPAATATEQDRREGTALADLSKLGDAGRFSNNGETATPYLPEYSRSNGMTPLDFIPGASSIMAGVKAQSFQSPGGRIITPGEQSLLRREAAFSVFDLAPVPIGATVRAGRAALRVATPREIGLPFTNKALAGPGGFVSQATPDVTVPRLILGKNDPAAEVISGEAFDSIARTGQFQGQYGLTEITYNPTRFSEAMRAANPGGNRLFFTSTPRSDLVAPGPIAMDKPDLGPAEQYFFVEQGDVTSRFMGGSAFGGGGSGAPAAPGIHVYTDLDAEAVGSQFVRITEADGSVKSYPRLRNARSFENEAGIASSMRIPPTRRVAAIGIPHGQLHLGGHVNDPSFGQRTVANIRTLTDPDNAGRGQFHYSTAKSIEELSPAGHQRVEGRFAAAREAKEPEFQAAVAEGRLTAADREGFFQAVDDDTRAAIYREQAEFDAAAPERVEAETAARQEAEELRQAERGVVVGRDGRRYFYNRAGLLVPGRVSGPRADPAPEQRLTPTPTIPNIWRDGGRDNADETTRTGSEPRLEQQEMDSPALRIPAAEGIDAPALRVPTPEGMDAPALRVPTPEGMDAPALRVPTPEGMDAPALRVPTPEVAEAPALRVPTPEEPDAPALRVPPSDVPEGLELRVPPPDLPDDIPGRVPPPDLPDDIPGRVPPPDFPDDIPGRLPPPLPPPPPPTETPPPRLRSDRRPDDGQPLEQEQREEEQEGQGPQPQVVRWESNNLNELDLRTRRLTSRPLSGVNEETLEVTQRGKEAPEERQQLAANLYLELEDRDNDGQLDLTAEGVAKRTRSGEKPQRASEPVRPGVDTLVSRGADGSLVAHELTSTEPGQDDAQGAAFDEALDRAEAAARSGDTAAQAAAEEDVAQALAGQSAGGEVDAFTGEPVEPAPQLSLRERLAAGASRASRTAAGARDRTAAGLDGVAITLNDYQQGQQQGLAERLAAQEARKKAAQAAAKKKKERGQRGSAANAATGFASLAERLRGIGQAQPEEEPAQGGPAGPAPNRSLAERLGRAAASFSQPPQPRRRGSDRNFKSSRGRRQDNRKGKGKGGAPSGAVVVLNYEDLKRIQKSAPAPRNRTKRERELLGG